MFIRGDMYREYKGESVGNNIEEQHQGLKTIQKHIVEPLVSQGHSVKIIVHVFCVGSMQEIAREKLNESLGNPLIVFVKVRQPTQCRSILEMTTTHLELMNQHDHVALVRIDLYYHMDLFPTNPLPTQKIFTLCPHISKNWSNDALVSCPSMHLERFLQFIKNRDTENDHMHQLPETFPVIFKCNMRHNSSSERGYIPFYHHIDRPAKQQRDDFVGELIRMKQCSDRECVLLLIHGTISNVSLNWMRTWIVDPLLKREYEVSAIVNCDCKKSFQETAKQRIYPVFDGLPLKIDFNTRGTVEMNSILERNANTVLKHDSTVVVNINLCCDRDPYPKEPLSKKHVLFLGARPRASALTIISKYGNRRFGRS